MTKKPFHSMSEETWKKVKGYPYDLSVSGLLYSRANKRLVAPYANHARYLRYRLFNKGKTVQRSIAALMLETFIGPRPKGYHAAHIDGSRDNNHLTNLKWCSAKENMADKKKHGTLYCGQKHFYAKLTDDDVREIRRRYKKTGYNKTNSTELAKEFGTKRSNIRSIVNRTSWKNI